MKKFGSFKSRIARAGVLPDVIMVILAALMLFYFSGIIQGGQASAFEVGAVAVLIVFVNAVLLAPIMDRIMTADLAKKLDYEASGKASPDVRMSIIKQLMIYPLVSALAFGLLYVADELLLIGILKFAFKIDTPTLVFIALGIFHAILIEAISRYIFIETICSDVTKEQLQKEIVPEQVHQYRFFGLPLYVRVFFHIIFPFVSSTATQIGLQYRAIMGKYHLAHLSFKMGMLLLVSMAIYLFLSGFFFHHIYTTIRQSVTLLEGLSSGSQQKDSYIPTDLGYELELNNFLINELLAYLESIARTFREASKNILASTSQLADVAAKNSEITLNERAGVTECLAIMEERRKTFASVTERVSNIKQSAERTMAYVGKSSELLKEEIEKMGEITELNLETISKIKKLSEKIDAVKKTIATINALAERNKMIAFNAELKASSTGEAGKNFHIIANELRRLVSTITSSTQEIQGNIRDIQETADNLIISSEGGTQKIRDGSSSFSRLEEKFQELSVSSTVTSESAEDMQDEMKEQYESFLQIYESLDQMGMSLGEFDKTTKAMNSSSTRLKETAQKLSTINEQRISEV
ncbi:MAG: methyl-accepting chemotaxis protein [Treponema sp.]|nr:methyl-accepting chemotaxis protein [Treponema sp.]MBQ7168103.1 methyl-accepting chemotaxis protein [Treponema sp.]